MDTDLCARPPKAVNKPGRHVGVLLANKAEEELEGATLFLLLLGGRASIDKVSCLQQTLACKSYIVIHVDRGVDVTKPTQRSRRGSGGA